MKHNILKVAVYKIQSRVAILSGISLNLFVHEQTES